MVVWIESIAVKDLGPIREHTFDLGRFNLLYGHNETGKTFLVEFLLRSLFRKSSEWKYRDLSGQGKVIVRGLKDEPLDFTPDERHKLEDYWEESGLGLPTNMAHLLVVKGGELALAESMAGIDRNVLKTVLSSEVLLDQILGRISKTIQDSQIEEGVILGSNRGEIKNLGDVKEKQERIEILFDRVDEHYSHGLLRSLEIREQAVSDAIEEQKKAKRYEAYRFHARKEELHVERDKLDDDDVETLGQGIRDYRRLAKEFERKQDELKDLADAARDYDWIAHAVTVWQSMHLEKVGGPHWTLLILGVLGILGGFGAGLLQYLIPGVIAFVLGGLLTAYYVWKLHDLAQAAPESEERVNIQSEYSERFGEPLTNLAALQAKEKSLHADYVRVEDLTDGIKDLQGDLDRYHSEIDGLFVSLQGSMVIEDHWEEAFATIKKQCKKLDDDMHDLDVKLGGLNVEESDYVLEKVITSFNADKLSAFEKELHQIDGGIKEASKDLESLKQSICDETSDDISEGWSAILEHLRDHRSEVAREYRELTAEIIAKIGVVAVLDEIKEQEDEKIQSGLQEEAVLQTLELVTGSYSGLQMTGGKLLVSGKFGNYAMDQLSTGAKEQILLALRMGFSTRLTGGKPLFLILDDAFQYSDWDRREKLVEKAVDLAKDGWQITYLSMDDHIRDLFDKAGTKNFKGDYKFHSID